MSAGTPRNKGATNRCMPVAEWPPLDRAAWAAALRPGDPFEPGGLAAGWSAATRTMTESGYGRWATWLARRDLLDPLVPPDARVSRERVSAYMADLRAEVGDFTVQGRLQQLGDALRTMVPDQNWHWILRAANRLRCQAVSVRNKRSRLQSPDRLVALGKQLMAQADSVAERAPHERAVTYRDGLIIAFLAYRPIRARTLTAIALGRQLVPRNGSWWLMFGPKDTKSRQKLEFPFPAELVPHLERYLAIHRPALLSRGGRRPPASIDALWVSQNRTAMVYAAIAYWVHRHTQAAFGAPLSAHLFRDCAATSIAIFDPEHVRIIKTILGHATHTVAEKHYNQATGLEAGRRYHLTIENIRRRTRLANAPGSRGGSQDQIEGATSCAP
jgi:integrase/recombinase XerD